MCIRRLSLYMTAAIMMGLPLFAPAGEIPPPQSAPHRNVSVSPAVAPVLKSAQQAIGRKDYVTALLEVDKADAIPAKTADDQYVINQMRTFIDARLRLGRSAN